LSFVSLAYDIAAGFYRRLIIRPSFERGIRTNFPADATLLHAGCGSGQVDSRLLKEFRIVGLDNSKRAIELYQATNGPEATVYLGSIDRIPFEDHSFSGVYNLGVMEHFTSSEINIALREFRRVLKPEGKLILWWPPEFGLSVQLLKLLTVALNVCGLKKKEEALFPAEISRIKSKSQIEALLTQNGFRLVDYTFDYSDLFTQVRIIAEPAASPL
jgi:ubiquinone/menaquinone biosynthesis C-methylase UbiE